MRLVDLRAGSTSHTLKGHGAQVSTLPAPAPAACPPSPPTRPHPPPACPDTHLLPRPQVTCLAWSPLTPSLLASGEGLGDDGRGGGKIILWDVRQAKSKLRSLDYNDVRGKVRDHGRVAGPAHQGRVLGVVFTGLTRHLALEN